jgi:cardiolipin synthase
VTKYPDLSLALYFLSWLIILGALFVVPRNRRPSSATAWLMLIALQPLAGAALFLLIGNPKLSKRRRAQQRRADELIAERVVEAKRDPATTGYFQPPIPHAVEPIVRLTESLGGMPPCVGNTVELIDGYETAIGRMAMAIDAATMFVHAEFYIMAMDETTEVFFQALENAVRRGVIVRLLIDHVASHWFPGRAAMARRLTKAGVDWHWSLPFRPLTNAWNRPDLRNHRKILVVDGCVAFTGSMNIIDATYLRRRNIRRGMHYVETVARLTGPVVLELNAVFLNDWFVEGGAQFDTTIPRARDLMPLWDGEVACQALPSGPGYDTDNNLKLFTALIHMARRRVFVTTPYFVPDDSLMTAITSAAQRGVEVHMLTAGVSNQFLVYHAQRSYYEELLKAGVRVYLLPKPYLLHAKHMTIDDDVAVVGSSNLDMRSFTLNLEITLVCYDRLVVESLRRIEQNFLSSSTELHLDQWKKRPLPAKLVDNLARLTASLQ